MFNFKDEYISIFDESYIYNKLAHTSFDDRNGEYMLWFDADIEVINGDNLIEKYVEYKDTKKVHSTDALYKDEITGSTYLIEFKNGQLDYEGEKRKEYTQLDIIILEIENKILHTLFTLMNVSKDNIDIDEIKSKFNFILVFNDEKNKHRTDYTTGFMEQAREELVFRGMETIKDKFEKLYLNKFYTLSPSEFEKKFLNPWRGNKP